ncbi:MAG: hypothetical protein ACREFR_04795 [Limisphaerales bacterium]
MAGNPGIPDYVHYDRLERIADQFVKVGEGIYSKTPSNYVKTPANVPGGAEPNEPIEEALERMDLGAIDRTDEFLEQLDRKLAEMNARTKVNIFQGRSRERSMEIYKNAPLGTIPLTGDARMEKLDSRHLMADMLELCLDKYKQMRPQVNFFEWVDRMDTRQLRAIIEPRLPADRPAHIQVTNFVQGVKYLDEVSRPSYQLIVRNGKIWAAGGGPGGSPAGKRLFDTKDYSTGFSGSGWAIFVISHDNRLYAGSHVIGKFHHSSFLSGAPVKAAGEMQVRAGDLYKLTAKTGHYKTPKENFFKAIQFFRYHRIDPHHYMVKAFKGPKAFWMTADEFARNAGDYEVWG